MAHNRFRRGAVHLLTAAFLVSTLTACHTVPRPLFANDKTTEASPLGPSYVLLPLPGDDDGLLGRVLPALPEQGRALDEIARPNPCEAHLEEARETALSNHFEDAQDVSGSARAGAIF